LTILSLVKKSMMNPSPTKKHVEMTNSGAKRSHL